ncbi:HAD hydrolase-like protein [Anaerolentibacter hominis]|uniref:HAD hydrolase-like protein n=1 Tax=Anaerolentibacter hominis TaxID=3079009 RepID=UPI0031B852C9
MGTSKKQYDYILFDLDGTICDSGAGIAKAMQFALKEKGVVIDDYKELYQYAGPPLEESFPEAAPHFSEEDITDAIRLYREYYDRQGWKENKLYPLADWCLSNLRVEGFILATASSKPTKFVQRIADYFQISSYFHHILGGNLETNRLKKAEVVADTLAMFDDIPELDKVVLVGDRKHDVEGGHLIGIDVIGVTFGYGGREELEEYGADYIVDSYEELLDLLIG